MTDEKQAVKTLAEQLAKAMKSVSANTPSKNYSGGTSPSTIRASKIVGLPAAFSSIINGVESSAAGGDAIAQQTLVALNHIAAGEFETITADTAMIEKVYATFGDFITLVAEDAQIGSLDVETIRAGLAEVGLINIGTASIDMAQIKRSSTQTAFIHESVQGKVYIDDLAVNDASIVNLAAGTVLINDNNGNLVELYVDSQGDVSTRAVSYDGSDIINQSSLSGNTIINNTLSGDAVIANSLNGNKIISNSITTTQLNANEIFAAQGTIMDLIADNIEATRLFANQGFITELQSTIISSDLSENSTIIELTDSINLFASNTSRTFIQDSMPIPTHTSDAWFDPTTEEHYVANAVYLPISQMLFGHDDGGNLNNEHSEDYQFSINSNGELMLLVTDEEAGEIIIENDIDFEIVNDRVFADGLWKKVDNIAFSRLKVSVDGIVSEVYDSTTGESRIEQNANRIIAIVSGDTSVPYVKTSSIEIKDDKVEIKSTGDVDIKASNFSISFNTAGNLANKSRVDINNNDGIKVSDSYGNYFQAKSTNIGLYDIQGTPRLYIDNAGHAFFNGSLTLGGANNVNGSLTVRNSNGVAIIVVDNTDNDTGIKINNDSGTKIGYFGRRGIEVYNASGSVRQLYIDSTTGNATFAGSITGGTINGASLTLGGANNASGTLVVNNASGSKVVELNYKGIAVYKGTAKQFYVDDSGNATFAGSITGGTINGASLTLGGANNASGTLTIKDANDNPNPIGTWDNNGLALNKGSINLSNGAFVVTTTGALTALNASLKGAFQNTGTDIWGNTINTRIASGKIRMFGSTDDGDVQSSQPHAYLYIRALGGSTPETSISAYVPVFEISCAGYLNERAGKLILEATDGDNHNSSERGNVTIDAADVFFTDNSTSSTPLVKIVGSSLYGGGSRYVDFNVPVNVYNSFTVASGYTKSKAVTTDQYANRLLYCYETPSPLFGDVGEGAIGDDGLCYVTIDPIFAQTITTNNYQVFLQRYGTGDCYVQERKGGWFVVAGTPGLAFGWEVKGKQADVDQRRLDRNDEKFTVPSQTYGEDAADHIKELYDERTQQDN